MWVFLSLNLVTIFASRFTLNNNSQNTSANSTNTRCVVGHYFNFPYPIKNNI